jgi:hypothetical protein
MKAVDIEKYINMNKSIGTINVDKNLFILLLTKLRDSLDRVNKLADVFNDVFESDLCLNNDDLLNVDTILALLRIAFNLNDIFTEDDQYFCDELSFFIYELDFGRSKNSKTSVSINNEAVDLSSIEKFYNYMMTIQV